MLDNLFARLSIIFLTIVVVLGAVLLYLSQQISEQYGMEVMQRLNSSVAMYVTDQGQLIDENKQVDEALLERLTTHAMVLNPSIDIYVLDEKGKVIYPNARASEIMRKKVNLSTIKDYIGSESTMPILGDDPRDPEQKKVFSVSPIMLNENLQGYVYVVIGGQQYQQLKATVTDNYLYRIGGVLMFVSLLAACIVGCVTFFILTKRLMRLKNKIQEVDSSLNIMGSTPPSQNQQNGQQKERNDEVGRMANALESMAINIHHQYATLQQTDQNRRELIANVSHDLRSPLASMQGYVETLMLKNNQLTEQQRLEYLNTVVKQSQRLANLTVELTELSKLESGTTSLVLEKFSFVELAYDCIESFKLTAGNKDVSLDVDNQSFSNIIEADISQIHRVLQNLIDNAIDHTGNGGYITIKIRQEESILNVSVVDTGIGMQSETVKSVFDRYYQVEQNDHNRELNTGLGLSIVKRVLDLHNIDVTVSSELGKGTSFNFSFPLVDAARSRAYA